MIFVNTLLSFIATTTFACIINSPRRSLLACGATGAMGWLTYELILPLLGNGAGIFCATSVIGMMSYFFARTIKMPVIIFNIPGLVPLVPGASAYLAVRDFLNADYTAGLQSVHRVVITAGAIAMGFMVTNLFERLVKKLKR